MGFAFFSHNEGANQFHLAMKISEERRSDLGDGRSARLCADLGKVGSGSPRHVAAMLNVGWRSVQKAICARRLSACAAARAVAGGAPAILNSNKELAPRAAVEPEKQ